MGCLGENGGQAKDTSLHSHTSMHRTTESEAEGKSSRWRESIQGSSERQDKCLKAKSPMGYWSRPDWTGRACRETRAAKSSPAAPNLSESMHVVPPASPPPAPLVLVRLRSIIAPPQSRAVSAGQGLLLSPVRRNGIPPRSSSLHPAASVFPSKKRSSFKSRKPRVVFLFPPPAALLSISLNVIKSSDLFSFLSPHLLADLPKGLQFYAPSANPAELH